MDYNRIFKLLRDGGYEKAEPEMRITALPASGSARRYFRLNEGSRTVMACLSSNIKENDTFLRLSGYFSSKNLPVAKILWTAPEGDGYILEDLGDKNLFKLLGERSTEGGWNYVREIVGRAIENLVRLQHLPLCEWEDIVQFAPLDANLIRYDFNYFIDNLAVPAGAKYDSVKLALEFEALGKKLLDCPRELWGLMYRDFQSRNVMAAGDKPFFIDFQSARLGPGVYDLVSFAWQAKAAFSREERGRIIEIYCSHMENYRPGTAQIVKSEVFLWAVFRIIQTLGAYGLRGLKEGKKHFIESISPALANLREILSTELKGEFSALESLINNLEEMPKISTRGV